MSEKIKRVTRKDVADRAGVTPTIVSYVINDNRYVDSEKKERVKKALKELGYRPNSLARALKGKSSNHILFIVDDLQSDHFGKIMKQMDKWAYKNDYFISLCESRNDESFVNQVYQRYFDGIIIASGTFKQKYIQQLIDTNIPIVLLEMRKYNKLKGNFALINSGLYLGARLCCKTLIEKNRKHLVFVDSLSSLSFTSSNDNDFRYQGFIDELKANGIYSPEHYKIISGCKNEQELNEEIDKLLKNSYDIDGIFGRTDSVAILAMYKLIDRGYSIPKDCSVIGVNNSRISRYTSPKLSSLDINREEIGDAIINILGRMFNEESIEKESLHIQLNTNLIKRESL